MKVEKSTQHQRLIARNQWLHVFLIVELTCLLQKFNVGVVGKVACRCPEGELQLAKCKRIKDTCVKAYIGWQIGYDIFTV